MAAKKQKASKKRPPINQSSSSTKAEAVLHPQAPQGYTVSGPGSVDWGFQELAEHDKYESQGKLVQLKALHGGDSGGGVLEAEADQAAEAIAAGRKAQVGGAALSADSTKGAQVEGKTLGKVVSLLGKGEPIEEGTVVYLLAKPVRRVPNSHVF